MLQNGSGPTAGYTVTPGSVYGGVSGTGNISAAAAAGAGMRLDECHQRGMLLNAVAAANATSDISSVEALYASEVALPAAGGATAVPAPVVSAPDDSQLHPASAAAVQLFRHVRKSSIDQSRRSGGGRSRGPDPLLQPLTGRPMRFAQILAF